MPGPEPAPRQLKDAFDNVLQSRIRRSRNVLEEAHSYEKSRSQQIPARMPFARSTLPNPTARGWSRGPQPGRSISTIATHISRQTPDLFVQQRLAETMGARCSPMPRTKSFRDRGTSMVPEGNPKEFRRIVKSGAAKDKRSGRNIETITCKSPLS